MRAPGDILLVACYEMGHQPLALAWPAAFLERAGYRPAALDLSVEPLDAAGVRRARLVAISVPMHTALRLGARVAAEVRALNPGCHVSFYGLYATLNAEYLLANGGDSVLAGECEDDLVALARRLETGRDARGEWAGSRRLPSIRSPPTSRTRWRRRSTEHAGTTKPWTISDGSPTRMQTRSSGTAG